MAAEVPQILEYMGGQLNVAPVLEMVKGNQKDNGLVMRERYKALMNELVNDGIKLSKLEINNSFINRVPKKWLSFCQSLRNTNYVKESELASLFGKLKYEENRIDRIYESEKKKYLITATPLPTTFFSTFIVQDFQDSPDDEEDTRSSQEYLNDEEDTRSSQVLKILQKRVLKTSVPSYSSPFQKPQTTIFSPSQQKPELRPNKDFKIKYNKVNAKLAILSSDVSSDDNDMTEVKVLMALVDDENVVVGKKSVRNGEWVKIFMRKAHTLLDIEDNDKRNSFLDYLCIGLNYVEEQRNNLVLKHRDLVQELNTCKEQLLVLKQAKFDFLTMQHVNIEILKENKNLRIELKELTAITKTWLNSSNKVNQFISELIPSQKKRILGLDQLTEDPSNSGQTDLVFVKSSTDGIKVSILGVERPWLSEAEGFTLPNHDTGRILPAESQVKITDPSVAITHSLATVYDSADESSFYSTYLPPLEKLAGVKPVSGPKTIKSILKSNFTFKVDTLKGETINEPSLAPTKGNKNSLASKNNSAPAGKLKNVKTKDDSPLSIVMKELNDLKLQISKN
ncbi:hypothetical protein Tco_0753128 [Tanacetum coccineum]